MPIKKINNFGSEKEDRQYYMLVIFTTKLQILFLQTIISIKEINNLDY